MLFNVLAFLGKRSIYLINNLGRIAIFIFLIISSSFRKPFYFQAMIKQFFVVGFFSLPVVGMTTFFSGAVLALQSYTGFSRFSAEGSIATVVALSITRELGPVLGGLMVAGRVGASIAAEIATMRVTEQIDALYTLSTDAVKYLILPRVISSVITLPLIVLVGDILGILGGYLVSVYYLDYSGPTYLISSIKYLELMDVLSGLVKASFFGFIVSVVSCYNGYYATKGARGVGIATTSAVVVSSVLILLSNYFLTLLFF